MKKAIPLYLIKSFDNLEYADEFLKKGEMYFNCPDYYRFLAYEEKYKESGYDYNKIDWNTDSSNGISDFNEGVIANVIRVFGDLPIYCMYTVAKENIIDSNILVKRQAFDEFKRSNHRCFVVCEIAPFFNQLKYAFGNGFYADFITYQNKTPKTEMDLITHPMKTIFRKSLRYAHQQEYRISLRNEKIQTKSNLTLTSCNISMLDGSKYHGILKDIGNISDFSMIISYEMLLPYNEEYYYFTL